MCASPRLARTASLIRLRNTHPAFEGTLTVETAGEHGLRLGWAHGDAAVALEVDLQAGRAMVVDTARA